MSAFKRASLVMNRLFSPNNLLLANTISCGTLMGLGDIFMQRVEALSSEPGKKHDWRRTGRMAVMGVVLGPINHVWYTALDKVLPAVTLSVIGRKILADQTIASPVFAFSFFMGMGTLEGQSPAESWDELRAKFWTVYKADWCFWPAAQAVNFRLVSPQFRVVYVASATLLWNTFLSYMKHKDECNKS